MPKGSQQTGSAKTSSESRAGAAQYPYFEGGLKRAAEIYGNESLYPNYAPATPEQIGGYQDLYNTARGTVGQGLQPQVYDAYGALVRGVSGPQQTADRVVNNAVNAGYSYANPITGYADQAVGSGKQYSGQLGGYADQAVGSGNQYGGQIAGYANQVAANNNVGLNQLMRTATENPATNPYLQDMVNAALRPVSENYQTSTAPTLDARFSAGGRYGSGAADVAAGSARDAFVRNMGEISTGMYGKEYEFNRNLQQQAADLYSQRYNAGLGLGMQGLASASEQARQGLGLGIQGLTAADAAMRQAYGLGIQGQQAAGNLVDQGERTALSAADLNQRGGVAALQMYPQFAQSMFLPARSAIDAGTGMQQLTQQAYNAPFERLKQYMATIGAPSGGTSSTQPIFGNPLTSALSGATGVLGLGKELGLGSAASSLFGGGGGGAGYSALANAGLSDFGGGGIGALSTGFAPALSAADYALPALGGSGGGKGAASFLPAIFA